MTMPAPELPELDGAPLFLLEDGVGTKRLPPHTEGRLVQILVDPSGAVSRGRNSAFDLGHHPSPPPG